MLTWPGGYDVCPPDDHACVQRLRDSMVFPSSFNRPYRCVVKYILSYVMEELANLIFIGSFVAKCGPAGFQTLWSLLQPAVLHYMYGREDTEVQRSFAEDCMRRYARKLEQLVIESKVPLDIPWSSPSAGLMVPCRWI